MPIAAVLVGSTFQSMQRLAQAPPAEQAEILAAARTSFERSPQGSVQLRYAMLLAVPGSSRTRPDAGPDAAAAAGRTARDAGAGRARGGAD
jgi:hypothetical protein